MAAAIGTLHAVAADQQRLSALLQPNRVGE
jgi:hypothetical protein